MKRIEYYNSFYSPEPLDFIPIYDPNNISSIKKVKGYKIYISKYGWLCCFIPICLKYKFYIYQEPIFEEKFMK